MENNKLIAEFMGIESDNAKMRGHLYECPVTAEYVSNLEYHISWDWLMPVIHKIKNISGQGVFMMEIGLPIEHVYKRVVEFIKQYNDEQ